MDPVTDSGGRVTRSLRKRISSVDGDNSSRPGTPVPSKLTAITEISSPSRPTRMTRRNSTSGVATPVKRIGTPSIIAESTEAVTPARRSTRRRSISINEGEETPHTIKVPVFESVAEEITTSVKPTTSRITRLQSKSPDESQANSPAQNNNVKSPESIMSGEKNSKTKSVKRRKPGPKSKTRLSLDELEVLSDVEVIIVEKEETNDENQANIKGNIVDLLDCDDDSRQFDINNLIAEKSQIENELPNSPKITSTSKEDLKISNAEITTVSDETIMIEESNDSTHNPLSSIELEDINLKKTDETSSQVEGGNVTIIDLMDCDDEPQGLSYTKAPEENNKATISSDSPSNILSESHLENDKETDANAQNENIFNVDVAECIPIKPSINIDEEMANESDPEEMSPIVINETLLNNSKSEITDTNVNESKIKDSPMNTLQQKENLTEIKFQSSDPMNNKDLEDISMQTENSACQQKDMASETPKSAAAIIEVNSPPSTPTTQDISLKKSKIISSPRLSANKLGNLNVQNAEASSSQENKNITIIDLMDCDDEPQSEPEENKITSILKESPKILLSESHLENDKETYEIAQNVSISDVNDAVECPITMKPTINIYEEIANESEPEEIPKMDSLTVINKSPEKSDINVNESDTINSPLQNLKEKGNLPEIDVQNEIMPSNSSDLNSKDLEDNPIQTEISQRKSTATIIEDININSDTQAIPAKRVEFSSSPIRDNTIKSVYPKTPAIIKSKRFMGLDTSRDENNTTIGENPECLQDEVEIENNNDSLHKLPEEKDTTEHLEDLGSSKDPKSNEQISENIDKVSSSPKEIENQLQWMNPSVKGYTNEGFKLDAVVKPANTPEKTFVNLDLDDKDEKPFTQKKGNAIMFSSDSNDEEENHENDDEVVELAPGEKPYKRLHVFHDDEAMEVDDYASGDSMDSEERREILENEIPVDAESIGSATTDDEHDDYVEEEDSENDSFIVSDNEQEENESTESDDEGDNNDNNARKKKKNYKRIQHPSESSSSDDLEKEKTDSDDDISERKNKQNSKSIQLPTESSSDNLEKEDMGVKIKSNINSSIQISNKNEFDTSKLSDSALRLQCTAESESEEELEEENKANISRKEILRKLNQSDRFNKSVRDLNPEADTSPIEHNEHDKSIKLQTKEADNISDGENDSEEIEEKPENEEREQEDQDEDEEIDCADEDDSSTSSSGENVKKNRRKRSESQLGEVSVTTESDGDKENNKENNKNPSSSNRMPGGGAGLSVSFGNFKKTNKNSTKERMEWQRSFTIGVSVKGCGLDTAVTENKSPIENTSSSPTFSNVDQDDELSSDDVRDLEKIRHMPLPLGNPLVRTRRQSLALPSNPDKEICSSAYSGGEPSKKAKRKSLGILSTNEFNPSQSFIDSMELRKNEFVRHSAKRKRLSKSFCGASEALDNSVIDIDVGHLHKRSKLALNDNNSMLENYHDSIENINTCKLSAISSTPREKVAKKDSNNNVQRILSRCDEILEAANRAKLEIKTNNKKSKVKLPKKNRKKPPQLAKKEVHQGDYDEDDEAKTFAKQKKHNDKIRAAALEQALKAADDVIHGKKIQKHLRSGHLDENDADDTKRISCDVLEAVAENVKNNNQKDITTKHQQKLRNHATTVTTSGNFVEMPQTPKKKKPKKQVEIIQLPTGKMSVEPITPKQRSVLACNGFEFHESPLSPFSVGFKVRQIPSTLKDRKRKRNFDEQPPMHTLPQPQWTQSGLFVEEEISTMRRRIARSEVSSQLPGSCKLKKVGKANDEQNACSNFKQSALMRGDIKRCTTRDILQLKERRQMQNQF